MDVVVVFGYGAIEFVVLMTANRGDPETGREVVVLDGAGSGKVVLTTEKRGDPETGQEVVVLDGAGSGKVLLTTEKRGDPETGKEVVLLDGLGSGEKSGVAVAVVVEFEIDGSLAFPLLRFSAARTEEC